jgi:putative transposase
MKLLEIGTDKDHVHFLVQSVPTYSVTKIVSVIKSLMAREILVRCPQFKKKLWGGEFWTDGYFASTVGKHGSESTIGYVKQQGNSYRKLHEDRQLRLF